MTSKHTVTSGLGLGRGVSRASIAVLAAASIACGTKEAPGPLEPTGPTGRIRFVNLITDATKNPVNAILEKVPFGVNLGYTGTTPSSLPAPNTANYASVYAGDRALLLEKTADTTVTVANFTVTVTANQDLSVYAIGGAGGGALSSFTTTDDNTAPAPGGTRVRVVNLSPTAGSIDVFITAPNADLSTATAAVPGLDYKTASNYLTTLSPGAYQLRAVPAGTAPANRAANVIISLSGITLAAGNARTIVAADNSTGGNPLRAFVLSDQ
jgi:uncharacterized protein DUF4397